MPPPSHDRALEIDGIRGWASFSVLLYHTFHEMLVRLLPWMNSGWLAPLFEGRLAVCVFFVLSGDALSANFLVRGASSMDSIDRLVVRRYTRLTFPILLSCAMVYVIRMAGADFHTQASVIADRPDWLGAVIAFPFSLVGLFRYTLLGVYTSHTQGNSYNPFLWTMSLEMIGSMLVFLTCYLWPRLKQPKAAVALVALALLLLNSFLCLFFAGMYLGVLRNEGLYARAGKSGGLQIAILAAFILLILILVVRHGYHAPLFFDLGLAIAIVFVLYSQQGLKSFLRNGLSTWLGDVSFPIYLVQFAVIISFESWMMMEWNARRAETAWLPLIGFAAVVVTVLVASAFRRVERAGLGYLDSWVLRTLRRD